MENSPKIYVGTYHKYNEGSLFGKWLDLTNYSTKSEFYKACYELHCDEEDPELMFQDWEYIPKFLISECSLSDDTFEYFEAIADFDEKRIESLEIYKKCILGSSYEIEISDLIEQFENVYMGYYGDKSESAEIEYAREYVEEMGLLIGCSETISRYFDYESYSRDLFLDGFSEYDGHVFCS